MGAMKRAVSLAVTHSDSTIMATTTTPSPTIGGPPTLALLGHLPGPLASRVATHLSTALHEPSVPNRRDAAQPADFVSLRFRQASHVRGLLVHGRPYHKGSFL
jgi:hypothetical protein